MNANHDRIDNTVKPQDASSDGTSRETDAARAKRLVDGLNDMGLELGALAERLGMPFCELGQWMSDPVNTAMVDGLLRLADVRMHLLVSRYRATAVVNLVRLTADASTGELQRRACVDLLRAEPGAQRWIASMKAAARRSGAKGEKAAPAAPPAPSTEAILRALEEFSEAPEDESIDS